MFINVSEECVASIFRIEDYCSLENRYGYRERGYRDLVPKREKKAARRLVKEYGVLL
jgi:hypothetical protein